MKKLPANKYDAIVGSNVKTLRNAKKMSQDELGRRIGVTFQQVQKYEKGTNRISAGRLVDISKVLGFDLMHFYQGVEEGESELPPVHCSEAAHRLANLPKDRQKIVITVLGMMEELGDMKFEQTARQYGLDQVQDGGQAPTVGAGTPAHSTI